MVRRRVVKRLKRDRNVSDIKLLNIEYEEWNSLPESYRELYEEACRAAKAAYAPYSNFSVGASILLANGEIISGSNQENVAYPSGLCAERTALFYANSRYPNVAVRSLLIVAMEGGVNSKEPITPCGSCRQVFSEVVKRFGDFEVVMVGSERVIKCSASSLLPFAFSMD